MKVLDLCSGIGGLTLGYQAHGWQPALFCEQNQYCQQVLQTRFEGVPIIPDIKNVTSAAISRYRILSVDGVVAGLPCPAFSVAGKRKASQDDRNLFPEFFRIIREIRPRWFAVENVPGLLSVESGEFFADVLRKIAALGFDAEWGVVSAASLGACHLRERLFIVAHAQSWQQSKLPGYGAIAQAGTNSASFSSSNSRGGIAGVESEFCGGFNGLPPELDRYLLQQSDVDSWLQASSIPRCNRLSREQIATLSPTERSTYRQLWGEYQELRKQHREAIAALGNAVVPQVAYEVFKKVKK